MYEFIKSNIQSIYKFYPIDDEIYISLAKNDESEYLIEFYNIQDGLLTSTNTKSYDIGVKISKDGEKIAYINEENQLIILSVKGTERTKNLSVRDIDLDKYEFDFCGDFMFVRTDNLYGELREPDEGLLYKFTINDRLTTQVRTHTEIPYPYFISNNRYRYILAYPSEPTDKAFVRTVSDQIARPNFSYNMMSNPQFSKDERLLFSYRGSNRNIIDIYNANIQVLASRQNFGLIKTLTFDNPIDDFAIHPNDNIIALSYGINVKIYDFYKLEVIKTFEAKIIPKEVKSEMSIGNNPLTNNILLKFSATGKYLYLSSHFSDDNELYKYLDIEELFGDIKNAAKTS